MKLMMSLITAAFILFFAGVVFMSIKETDIMSEKCLVKSLVYDTIRGHSYCVDPKTGLMYDPKYF